jgi:hypothetical protein
VINAPLECVCNAKCSSIQSGQNVMMFAAYSVMHVSCSSLRYFLFKVLKLCGPINFSSFSTFRAKNLYTGSAILVL